MRTLLHICLVVNLVLVVANGIALHQNWARLKQLEALNEEAARTIHQLQLKESNETRSSYYREN